MIILVIGDWRRLAAVTGGLEIGTAVRLRRQIRNEWILAAVGVLSITFAAVLVTHPTGGAIAVTWLIGWYALISGALVLALAYELRKLESIAGHPGRARSTRKVPA